MTKMLPDAVLWDMDGTIIDSEPAWMRAESELVTSFGHAWTAEDAQLTVGFGLWECAGILVSRGVDLSEAEIIDRLTARVIELLTVEQLWRPGALEMMKQVQDARIPQALVTASFRSMAQHVADSIPFAPFDVIIAGDDVTHNKPHPEPYLMAAQKLGVDPTRSIAFEDSVPGTASAVAAGTMTIAVPHQSPLPEGAGYTLWSTLSGRGLGDLEHVVRGTQETQFQSTARA
ncbi:HAD family phosphatase [Homoserinimonas sp. OAct 916]|uniref:HAD family hydrolase n=1 Tax=Homoserinimonas sp. OAct 916 TaxID=2211450 RepID=UPI000DBE564E|nr:HAD family phosphatase [Homoserinimonas sp. OAct 916]